MTFAGGLVELWVRTLSQRSRDPDTAPDSPQRRGHKGPPVDVDADPEEPRDSAMLAKVKREDWRKLAESMPDEALAAPSVRGPVARPHSKAKEGTGIGGNMADNGSAGGGGDDASEASSGNDNDGQASMASSAAVEHTEEVSVCMCLPPYGSLYLLIAEDILMLSFDLGYQALVKG